MRSSITLHGHRYSAIAGEARGGTVASSRERLISVSALTGSGVRAYGRRSKRNNMHYQQNRASVRAGLATQHTPYRRDTSKLDREGSHCYTYVIIVIVIWACELYGSSGCGHSCHDEASPPRRSSHREQPRAMRLLVTSPVALHQPAQRSGDGRQATAAGRPSRSVPPRVLAHLRRGLRCWKASSCRRW